LSESDCKVTLLAGEQVPTLPIWILFFFRLYFNPRGEALFRCWSCYSSVVGPLVRAVRVRPGCLLRPIRSRLICTRRQATCVQEHVRVLQAKVRALFCCFFLCLETAWRVRSWDAVAVAGAGAGAGGSRLQQDPEKGSAKPTKTSILRRFFPARIAAATRR